MKKLFLFCTLFLFGCGDGGGLFGAEPNDYLYIGEGRYDFYLPENWVKLEVPEDTDGKYLARQASQNFVILTRKTESDTLAQDLWENAPNGFSYFEPLSVSENRWSFQAKVEPKTPIREYHQKVFPVPGYDFFVMASCSFDLAKTEESDCSLIVDSFVLALTEEEA